jgi:hypothetical protein
MDLATWLATPEAQATPHYWLATAAGHVLIGMAAWAVLSGPLTTRRRAALAVALAYAGWEAVQVAAFGGGLLDGALDWAFVMGGALVAWAAWAHRGGAVAGCVAVLAVIGLSGAPRGPHV